ncbi:MAG: branched-chain amino acid ABC transporter permease [Gaiellaceae bacterium]
MISTPRQALGNLAGLGVLLLIWVVYAVYFSPTQGWTFFLQLTVDGIILGSIYSLIALGYSMVYGILKLLNFAHGDVYMIGAFIGFGVLTLFGGPLNPAIPVALLVLCMFVVAMLGSGFLGLAIERFAYRPLRDAPRIAPLISALGVAFFLENSVLLLLGANYRNYDGYDLISYNGIHLGGSAGVFVSYLGVMVIVGALLLMVGLIALVRWTQFGKAMRAVSFDREAAAMMGIDPDRVIAITFFVGSALGGAAGVMFGLVYSQIYYLVGFLAGLKGFTAAVVGGIGSIPGAMLGGLLVGLVESWAKGYLNGNVADLVVFGILIGVMLIRPSGLLGTPALKKV